ncbi:hypothetical protein GCM10028818_44490 [Spirosoma horti]
MVTAICAQDAALPDITRDAVDINESIELNNRRLVTVDFPVHKLIIEPEF